MARRIYEDPRWKRVRLYVLRRDAYRCHWCGGQGTEADHLVSLHEGGAAFSPSNLVASCKKCNASRGSQAMHSMRKGRFIGATRGVTRQSSIGQSIADAQFSGAIRL